MNVDDAFQNDKTTGTLKEGEIPFLLVDLGEGRYLGFKGESGRSGSGVIIIIMGSMSRKKLDFGR